MQVARTLRNEETEAIVQLYDQQIVGGRYRIIRLIERRPDCIVYRAEHVTAQQPVRLAALPEGPRDAERSARFRDAVRDACELRHPNVARVLDYGYLDDGTPYYVEEYPAGATLFRELAEGPLGRRDLLDILRDSLEGLRYLHSRGQLHLALVPANIVIPERPAATHAQLGGVIFRSLERATTGGNVPQPHTAAPEVLRGATPTPASDIYGFGLLAAAALTGQLLTGLTAPESLHLSDRPWKLDRHYEIEPEFISVIERCLAKDPARRYQSVDEVLRAMDEAVIPVDDDEDVFYRPMMPVRGEILHGRYDLLEVLGTGGFAQVFKAFDTTSEEVVAVKVLHPHLMGTKEHQRFEREGRLVFTHLEQAHTVQVVDYGRSEEGIYFIATDFVAGRNLEEVLEDEGALPPRRVVAVMRQVLASLEQAHRIKVFHRDIKPANIMLSDRPYTYGTIVEPNCWATVLDFGIASIESSLIDGDNTMTGASPGTPQYMAPEQAFGDPVGADTDLYALGLVAYELLTNTKAVPGTSTGEIIGSLLSKVSAELPPEPALPHELRSIVNRLLCKDRDERYQSAREVLTSLTEVLI